MKLLTPVRLLLVMIVFLAVDVTASLAQAPPRIRADFNHDGFDDLAIGVPGENDFAGAVHIIYGSAAGLTATNNRLFSQDTGAVPGTAERADRCGDSLAAGDFNHDGFVDLAFGCDGETLGSAVAAGAVVVLYGSRTGLTDVGSQFWSQDSTGINGTGESSDRCGSSLAAGDFNGDGFADLAWGCPGEKVDTADHAGAVNVLFGSPSGLTATGNRFISQNSSGVPGTAEADDRCGTTLATGDFNGDGRSDLAFGCPGEDIGLLLDAGAVSIVFGASTGISESGGLFVDQDFAGSIPNGDEAFDNCGEGLAAGDFNNDGRDDLVMGCPGEDYLSLSPFAIDRGSTHVFFGVGGGLAQGGILEFLGSGRCGAALTTGDFNGDGFADIASGCPAADGEAGEVEVFHGASTLNHFVFASVWSQDAAGVPGGSESRDHFGTAVAAGDFNGDGFSDLAIGVPDEELASGFVGAINVIYGSRSTLAVPRGGLLSAGAQFFSQDTAGIVDSAENGDQFGLALAGSGGAGLPGLTGRWQGITQSCHGSQGAECTLSGTFVARNPSRGATPAVAVRFYLSADQSLDPDDLIIGDLEVKPLDPGDEQSRSFHVALPRGVSATGFSVIAFVDADNIVFESNERNNVVASDPIQ